MKYEVTFDGSVVDTFEGEYALERATRFAEHHEARGRGYTIEVREVTPSIHDLFQAVREHPDYAGGTVFTREDVAGAVFGDDDGDYTPADVERVTPAMLAEAAKVIENWIMGDSVYTWSDALRENVTVEA